ncbi:hypothetical protein ACLOJK_017709 [Asimina triloba]
MQVKEKKAGILRINKRDECKYPKILVMEIYTSIFGLPQCEPDIQPIPVLLKNVFHDRSYRERQRLSLRHSAREKARAATQALFTGIDGPRWEARFWVPTQKDKGMTFLPSLSPSLCVSSSFLRHSRSASNIGSGKRGREEGKARRRLVPKQQLRNPNGLHFAADGRTDAFHFHHVTLTRVYRNTNTRYRQAL